MLLGSLMLLFPYAAVLSFTLFFAAFALIDGILSVAAGWRHARRAQDRWLALILRGVLGIAIAALFLFLPLLVTASLAVAVVALVAVWCAMSGLFEIAAAIRLRKELRGEWLLGLSGALSLAVAVAIVALSLLVPASIVPTAAAMLGIFTLVLGVTWIAQALRLRAAARTAEAKQ